MNGVNWVNEVNRLNKVNWETREYLIIHLVVKVLTFSPHGE